MGVLGLPAFRQTPVAMGQVQPNLQAFHQDADDVTLVGGEDKLIVGDFD